MSKKRQEKIDKFRRMKSVKELERKFNKAKGRHSKNYWCVEHLDYVFALADELYFWFEKNKLKRD